MGKDILYKADTRILGQLLAAQNVLFALTSEKQIAEFYAKLLSSVPGISSCKVCFGNSNAMEGQLDDKPCQKCPNIRIDNNEDHKTWNLYPCKLSKPENHHITKLETLDCRFGFFILKIEQQEIFEVYKPFISNLGSFVALSLENRLQKANLKKVNDQLENKVESRTKELQAVNERLKKEIKKHNRTVIDLQNSEEQLRFFYETMVQGVVIQDINGKVVDANEAACKILGLSKDQILGKTTQDPRWKLIHEDGSPLGPDEMPSNIALATGQAVKNKLMGVYIPDEKSYRWILTSSIPKFSSREKGPDLTLTTFSEITDRKKAEQERINHLNFLKHLNHINQIILKSEDLEQMMRNVLDEVQEIFGSDRTFLMYPCDPESPTWSIPIERTKPEFPGVLGTGINIPMDPGVAKSLRIMLDAGGPVQFGPGTSQPLPTEVSKTFGFRSILSMALYPKTGKPWQFGIHQCESTHIWTTDEERLFQAIGYRLSDALGNLLTLRELQQSEQRFKLVFENSPVSIWEENFSNVKTFFDGLRNNGISNIENYFSEHPEAVSQCAEMVKIVNVNQSALSLHGAKTKQDLKENLVHLFVPESFETFRSELICLWNGQTEMTSDTVLKTLEGKNQNVTIYFSVSPGYEESLSKILVSIIDITQRVQTETELKRSETRYRSLYNNTPVMLHSIDREGKLISVSDYWLTTLGYTREEVIGHKSTEFLTEESQRYATKVVLPDFMKKGECYNIDYQFIKKDGQVIDCLLSAISERDTDGSIIRSLAVITNITERKHAEKAILINEERYRMAQSIGHVGNWEYNLQTGTFWGSDEAKRIYGFDPVQDSFTTDEVENCIPERERVHQALIDLVENGKPYNLEFEIYPLHSAEPRTIASIADLIRDKQGNPIRVVGVVHDITKRKFTENALNDTTNRLKEAQRLAHIGSWELDLKSSILNWSDEIYRIFEIDPEKFGATYEAFLNAIHPDDRLMVDTAYTNSLKTKTPYSIDHRLLFDDDRIKYVHEQCKTFYEGDVPVRSIGTVQDITERKLTEIKTSESEQLFRALVENSPDYISRYDRDYHRIYVNPSIQKLFGSSEKVLGETPAHKSPVYTPEIYIKNIQQVFETGSEKSEEIPFRTEKGEMHWGHMRFVPEFDQKGDVKSVLAVGRDINEIKENEKRFRMLAENFPDFVFRFNKNCQYEYVNPAVEKVVGTPSDDFMGKTIVEFPLFGKPEQNETIIKHIRRTFKEGKIIDSEILWDTREGKRMFELRLVPEKDAAGKVISVIVVARDITQRKQAETINLSRLHLIQFAATHSIDELLEETLNEAEKLTESKIGFYHFVEDDQVSLTLQNWSTQTKSKFCKAEGKGIHYPVSDAGVWVDCMYQLKPVIHNDYASLPHRKGMPDGHAKVTRELVVPVIRGDKVKAILGIGNKLTDYNKEDVEIISLLADLAWEIAERKRAEEKVLQSEQRLRLHMEQSPVGFLEWDDKFCATAWNAACENIFGYTKEEAIGRHAKDLILPAEVHELVDDIYQNLMTQTGGQHGVNKNVTKDGRAITCEWFNTTLINKEGIAIGVASICNDITEQKQMEEELTRHRNHLEELVKERTIELEEARNKAQQYLNIAGVMMVAINADQEITLINQKGCEVLGSDYSEIIGKNWFKTFVPEQEQQNVIQEFNMLMSGQGEQVKYYENPVITRNGEERLIAWHNILLHDENGNINGTLSSGEDITERKKAEEQIKKLNNDLQNRALELQTVNKELEAFAYSVSHDLRAPLRHIDGFMELLEAYTKDSLDEKSHDYMDKISGSAKRMGKLIDELLSFSRMARQRLLTNTVDLNVLVNEVIQDLIPDFKEREIIWNIAELPKVKGDKSLLRVAVVNLILNAIKFTRPRKHAIIDIGYRKQKKEYVFFVKDNGVGFDPAYKDKLFGVFQRLHRADEFEGTGIGLANVYRIISRHGGKVWAEGAVNKGATFFFSLPFD